MNTERIREQVAWEVQAQLRPLYINGADLSLDVVGQIYQWAMQCVADEREACAMEADYEAARWSYAPECREPCESIAIAIRARGNDAVDIK